MPEDQQLSDPLPEKQATERKPDKATGPPLGGISFGDHGTFIVGGSSHSVGGHNDSPAGKKRLTKTGKFIVGVAAVVSAIVATVTLWVTLRDDPAKRDGVEDPPGAMATNGGTGVPVQPQVRMEAKIEKTWDVDSASFVGVRSYLDPTAKGRDTAAGHFLEGNTITVLCYKDGREIEDKPWQDRPLSSKVWYKIESPRDHWVPGLYVGFPQPGGQPANLPVCT
ncbi:hypothetical protein [Micromonospora parva]|uniref:Serine/threonine protein kinase n=1 Tax=Micromonospora parva TaxID=1464048 RepID=A0ABW6VP36_9ACTN